MKGNWLIFAFNPIKMFKIGDIYKVKITEILPNDSGAFVSYGNGDQKGFL